MAKYEMKDGQRVLVETTKPAQPFPGKQKSQPKSRKPAPKKEAK